MYWKLQIFTIDFFVKEKKNLTVRLGKINSVRYWKSNKHPTFVHAFMTKIYFRENHNQSLNSSNFLSTWKIWRAPLNRVFLKLGMAMIAVRGVGARSCIF